MILAADVQYENNTAWAAAILFENWTANAPVRTLLTHIPEVADYQAGEFYHRELPCLLALIKQLNTPLSHIVVDGFVTLGEDKKPGLGWKLWEALDRQIPVIGVAKTRFAGTPPETALYRGESKSPLYVTGVGLPLEEAKANILVMHGQYRLPTLLKQVDRLARRLEEPLSLQ